MIDSLNLSGHVSAHYDGLFQQLRHHRIYNEIPHKNNLRIFMQHHVFAVWDFMSLIKSLQIHLAPTRLPWVPPHNARFAHFINQMVLEEESDFALTDHIDQDTHASHFESYCLAMHELGANINPVLLFVERVRNNGLESALNTTDIPPAAKQFMAFTFEIIERNEAHLTAAVIAYGRETLVPELFQSILQTDNNILSSHSIFNAYLKRHIQLDSQNHGPLMINMVRELCHGSGSKFNEAIQVAEQAINIRLEFWDGIVTAMDSAA